MDALARVRAAGSDHGPPERLLRLRADVLARGRDALPRLADTLPRSHTADDVVHPGGNDLAFGGTGLPARCRVRDAVRHLVEVDEAPVPQPDPHPALDVWGVVGRHRTGTAGLRPHGGDRYLGVQLQLRRRRPSLAFPVPP